MPGPLQIVKKAPSFVWDVAKKWYYGGIGDLAAGVTFWIFLTLPAAILAMVAALGWLGTFVGESLAANVEADIITFINDLFSSDVEEITKVVHELFQQKNSGVVTISIALAFWTISRGFAGLLRAIDDVYEVEDGRAWYWTRTSALVLGLGSLLVSVPLVILELWVWTRVPDGWVENLLRFVTSVGILVLWASMIFHFGASIRSKWRWDLPGALVSAVLWWGLTLGFRYYVAFALGGNEVLGVIGAWILSLTWVWMAAQGLLIGAAVNAVLGDRLGIDRGKKDWKINEKLFKTSEMKVIKIAKRSGDSQSPKV